MVSPLPLERLIELRDVATSIRMGTTVKDVNVDVSFGPLDCLNACHTKILS